MLRKNYTDQEFITGLKRQNEKVVKDFFYGKLESLLKDIQYNLFKGKVDYDELVNELYIYLQKDNWCKLDSFTGMNKAHLRTWVSVVAWRFFLSVYERIVERDSMEDAIENKWDIQEYGFYTEINMDIERVFQAMRNERYVEALRLLIIEGYTPEEVAVKWEMKVDNVYNIKHRAIAKFIKYYGKR